MPINLRTPDITELKPRITVLGVGGAGGNAVNNMVNAKLEGVSFVVANTDAQALTQSRAERRIQLGARMTEGLGAGAKPDVGRGAAEESIDEIIEHLSGAHMVFITAGMGGGTGTGAAPVIARAVRELGILTVGVVTKPFHFEGDRRMKQAERGIEELQNYVDTLIIIPNQNLFRVATERTTFAQAFTMADEVLHSGVRGITDLIVMPGLINRDFADIKTVMSEMGKAMMGTGEMDGENRALRAAEAAISNPLLDEVSMKGARAVLVNVTGGPDLMLFEVDEAVNRIRAEVDPDANILFGSALSETLEGRVRVSVVATGIESEAMMRKPPTNVEKFPARGKPLVAEIPMAATGTEGRNRIEVTSQNPVHMQYETLSQGIVAQPGIMQEAHDLGMRDAVMLGGTEAPMVAEQAPMIRQESPMVSRQTQPEPAKRSWLFGSRRQPKQEPVVQQEAALDAARYRPGMRTQAADPRAPNISAPTGTGNAGQVQGNAPTAQGQGRTPQGEDLFGGVQEDDRFEIPAFLRRQNSGN